MGRKWVLVEDDSNKVVVWLCALLGQESVMHDDDKIIVFCFKSTKKEELTDEICRVNRNTNKTDVDSKCEFIDVDKFNDISNHLANMDNMVVLLDIKLDSIQGKSDFAKQSQQKTFWLNCIRNNTKNNVICITSTESNPQLIMKQCGEPDRMRSIGTVNDNLTSVSDIENDIESAQSALQQADKFWLSLNGPNRLLSALKEAQKITNGEPAHPNLWPPKFKNEGRFPFNVDSLKHKGDDSNRQALQAFKALFEFFHQQSTDLCEKATVLGVWCCKGCRPLTVKHIADMLEQAGIQCIYNPDVETQEINLPTMPGVVFLWRLAKFLLEGLDGWNEEVTFGVDDNGDYLHPYFSLPIPNDCYHDFIASYHVRGNHQGTGVSAFEDLLCCRLPDLSEGFNGGDIKYVNNLGGNCSKIGTRLVPLIRHEFRDKEIYISWVSKKFEKAVED